jgi:DNA-directed RNA polymerase subunit alpha
MVPGADKRIKDLGFSVRTFNCLRKVGISTVAELIAHSESELIAIKNFGRKSLNEVKDKLTEMGLSLRESGEYIPENLGDEE